MRELAVENNRLQRVRRVIPLLARLADTREALSQLADAPHLPPDSEARFRALVAARRDAARDVERETAASQRLAAERAALPQDAPALAAQDTIDALAARRPVVLQATTDLPDVHAKAAALRASVVEAIDELGLDLAPETARDDLPAGAARRTVQRLIRQHAALSADAEAASRRLATARRRHAQAEQALRDTPEPASPVLLRRTIESVRAEGRLDTELDRADRALTEATAATAAALSALPLWHGDAAALVACALPLPAETNAAAARLEACARERAETQAERSRLTAEIAACEDEIARLTRGDPVPTPGAVAEARAARDRLWHMLRRVLEGGPPPDPVEMAGLPGGPMPEAYEALVDQADRLADRRAEDAQRVADFLNATARLDLLRGQHEKAATALAQREDAVQAAEAAWRALWAPSGVVPNSPAAMAEWRSTRAEVVRLTQAEAEARRHRDDLAARRTRAQAALAALLPDLPPQPTLGELLLRAVTACEAAEAAEAAYRERRKTLEDEADRLAEQQQANADAAAALETWTQDWGPAVAALRLPPDAAIDVAEAALSAWQRIAEAAPAWRTEAERIANMTASIEAFTSETHSLQPRLGDPPGEETAPVIVARLARRLAEARKAALDAERLAADIAAHDAAAADAVRRRDAADADLAVLRDRAGATDDPALERAIDRARQRDALAADTARLEEALLGQGDGMAEEALRAEISSIEPDALVARLAEIESEQAGLGQRREELSAQRTRAEAALNAMRDGHDATSKAQEAQDALADARAAAERFARLRVGAVLLRAGIDRFRKEQQGPLLRTAGAYFALLTDGRYERLLVDYDAAGRAVLLAVRETGIECPVEALSEGARDQLYLALRVAAIQAHADRAEPLPFIADDLLVHFDDVRAAAAISLLRELGKRSQVILFTHHDHIAALAGQQPGVAVQRMASVAPIAAAAAE